MNDFWLLCHVMSCHVVTIIIFLCLHKQATSVHNQAVWPRSGWRNTEGNSKLDNAATVCISDYIIKVDKTHTFSEFLHQSSKRVSIFPDGH